MLVDRVNVTVMVILVMQSLVINVTVKIIQKVMLVEDQEKIQLILVGWYNVRNARRGI